MIPELRRKINDSYIGRTINKSLPGMLVERSSDKLLGAVKSAVVGGLVLASCYLYTPKTESTPESPMPQENPDTFNNYMR